MKLLPKERITIYSNDTVQQALDKLTANISPGKGIFSRGNVGNTYFTGYINKNFFEAERCIEYRNSFLPKIRGAVETNGRGCAVHVEFKLNDGVFAFMIFWIGFASIAAISITVSMFTSPAGNISYLLSWLFPLIGFGFPRLGFNSERDDAQKFLIKLFDGAVNDDWN